MIRLIQRRLIVPRGDTGTFTIPVLAGKDTGDVSIFTVFDPLMHRKIFEKVMTLSGETLTMELTHGDTVNLPVGQYVWDIKFYTDPIFAEEKLIGGTEVDSYYAAFTLPVCEIRETGDNLLMSDDAPTGALKPGQIDFVTASINEMTSLKNTTTIRAAEADTSAQNAANSAQDASVSAQEALDSQAAALASQQIAQTAAANAQASAELATQKAAEIEVSLESKANIADLATVAFSGAYSDLSGVPTNISTFINDVGYLTQHQDISMKANSADLAAVATSGAYSDLSGTPTNVSTFTNDAGYLTQHQDISGKANSADLATVATSGSYNDLLNKPTIPEVPVQDVQINNTSIVDNGIANIPIADIVYDDGSQQHSTYGISKYQPEYGISVSEGSAFIVGAAETQVKAGTHNFRPITPIRQHLAVFYGLAKAAGHDEKNSNLSLGQYTSEAKTAIQQMLDVPSTNAIPTQVSQLTNDAGYLTSFTETDPTVPAWAKAQTKPTYTAAEVGAPTVQEMNSAISTAIGNINSFDMAVVQELPTQNINTHTIYLVPKTGETNDVYDEYIYINNAWEMIGNTQIDLSDYATKNEVLFESGSAAGAIQTKGFTFNKSVFQSTASGIGAFATGIVNIASGISSFAEGQGTEALGQSAHTEGQMTTASGYYAHAQGSGTTASGSSTHAEGDGTTASGLTSHAQGLNTIANSAIMFASGMYNIADTIFSEWVANTQYEVGDKVSRGPRGYKCKVSNTDSDWIADNWESIIHNGEDAFVIGNGTSKNNRSNALKVDWNGNEYLMGDVYVHANADSSNGIKLAKITDIPDVPVQDVQINGSSILDDGIANIPYASSSVAGVIKYDVNSFTVNPNNGKLIARFADESAIKTGSGNVTGVCPKYQHISVFYGLSKVAGVDLANETVTLGVYPDTSKAAIQNMLGISDLIATRESSTATATHTLNSIFLMDGKLYKATSAIGIGDAIAAGTNCTQVNITEAFATQDDLSLKADKTDTVLNTTLSRGRKANSTIGERSIAFGYNVEATALGSIAMGNQSQATGVQAHAEGEISIASGIFSYARGNHATASGYGACATGEYTIASGSYAYVEGGYNTVSNQYGHVEGSNNIATSQNAHVEGLHNFTSGHGTHVEGRWNRVKAGQSHVQGVGNDLHSTQRCTHVAGINNITPTTSGKTVSFQLRTSDDQASGDPVSLTIGQFAEIIGNGESDSARSNARTLDWDGNEYLNGNIYVGCNNDSTGGTRLATITEVAAKLDAAEAGLKVVRLI